MSAIFRFMLLAGFGATIFFGLTPDSFNELPAIMWFGTIVLLALTVIFIVLYITMDTSVASRLDWYGAWMHFFLTDIRLHMGVMVLISLIVSFAAAMNGTGPTLLDKSVEIIDTIKNATLLSGGRYDAVWKWRKKIARESLSGENASLEGLVFTNLTSKAWSEQFPNETTVAFQERKKNYEAMGFSVLNNQTDAIIEFAKDLEAEHVSKKEKSEKTWDWWIMTACYWLLTLIVSLFASVRMLGSAEIMTKAKAAFYNARSEMGEQGQGQGKGQEQVATSQPAKERNFFVKFLGLIFASDVIAEILQLLFGGIFKAFKSE